MRRREAIEGLQEANAALSKTFVRLIQLGYRQLAAEVSSLISDANTILDDLRDLEKEDGRP